MPKHDNGHIDYLAKSYKQIYVDKLIELIGEPERLDLLTTVAWSGAIEEVYVRLHKRSRQHDLKRPQQLKLFE